MDVSIIHRLVSSYEDKVLGLTAMGENKGKEAVRMQAVKNRTFPEFVDHVLKDCKYRACNEHWEPQYMHCNYCNIRYDMIGRVENLENDLEYIAMVKNFSRDLHNLKDNLHLHPSGVKRPETPTESFMKKNNMTEKIDKTKRYFMQLSTNQVKAIYNMYKIDFEMFGYSTEPYHPE